MHIQAAASIQLAVRIRNGDRFSDRISVVVDGYSDRILCLIRNLTLYGCSVGKHDKQ